MATWESHPSDYTLKESPQWLYPKTWFSLFSIWVYWLYFTESRVHTTDLKTTNPTCFNTHFYSYMQWVVFSFVFLSSVSKDIFFPRMQRRCVYGSMTKERWKGGGDRHEEGDSSAWFAIFIEDNGTRINFSTINSTNSRVLLQVLTSYCLVMLLHRQEKSHTDKPG